MDIEKLRADAPMGENQFYGWFDDSDQQTPSYEPPRDAPCLFCGQKISADDVRTHSITHVEGYARRSYFYRTHRTCAVLAIALAAAAEEAKQAQFTDDPKHDHWAQACEEVSDRLRTLATQLGAANG